MTARSAAVERARRAFVSEITATWSGVGPWSITISDDAMRNALAAALDVEEMARVIAYGRPPTGWDRHTAGTLRTAILGPDS
jgi:hypothetical protein